MPLSSIATPFSTPSTGRDIAMCDLTPGVFALTEPTPGTAISGHAAATTFDETKALLYLYNAGAKNVYLLGGLIKLSNAGTAGTTIRFEQALDTGPRTPSAGNAAANTLAKGNTSGQGSSGVTAYFGAVVIPAASSSRQLVGGWQYRSVIGVVTDTYGFQWGAPHGPSLYMPQTSSAGTSEADITVNFPPVRIPPGMVYTLHQWSGSQSGAYQFEPVLFWYVEC